jgi:DnaJ like chaperone protein
LFDQARDSTESYEPYAAQLAEAFADHRGVLEQVLNSLFNIARADGPLNAREQEFLRRVHRRLGLDQVSWDRAFGEMPRRPMPVDDDDPYMELGLTRAASGEELRATWKRLMRENHPDSLASRGVPADFVARASDKVARINAAWDRIKRERGL